MKHAQSRIRKQAIVDGLNAGRTQKELAEAYGITIAYVCVIAARHNVLSASKLNILKRRAIIAELHSLDVPGGLAREMLGLPISIWQGDVRALKLKFRSGTSKRLKDRGVTKKRAERMCAMYRSGMTLQQIGDRHGISRERVRQLMTKYFGVNHKDGGQAVTGRANKQRSKAARDARYLRDYGCTFDQYVEAREVGRQMVAAGRGVYSTPLRAFSQQRGNARQRGIGWEMNFWQWWTIWQDSGKWEQRGLAKHSYVMSRFMDEGPYAVGNVVICTLAENSSAQPNNPYRADHPDHGNVVQKNSRVKRGCAVDGCTKPHYAHSYCNNHYYHFVTKVRASGEQVAA